MCNCTFRRFNAFQDLKACAFSFNGKVNSLIPNYIRLGLLVPVFHEFRDMNVYLHEKSVVKADAPLLQKMAKRAVSVKPGEEKALDRTYGSLPVCEWGLQKSWRDFLQRHIMTGQWLTGRS